MLQNYLVVAAVVGLLLVEGGHCQCYTDTICAGDTIDVTEAGLPIADQADCCVGTNAGLSYNDATCNLCIVHGFAQAAYDVVEDERLDTMFQLNVKGTTQFGGLVVAGFITATADGTAEGSDFERLEPIQVTNNAEIRLFAANDEIALEYDDRVLLTFVPDDPALITGLPANGEYVRDSATVNIIDNDLLEINFLESDYSILEGSAALSSPIMIQLRQNQNPFTLTLSPVTIDTAESKQLGFFINSQTILPGSRATAVDDFSDNVITITVPANSNPSYEITQFFTINDDDIDEDEQSFAIVAEIGPDVPDGISCFQLGIGSTECFGRRGATEIRITDNDPMIIGFTQRIRTVSEGQVAGVDLFQLEISVESVRTAERVHPMVFRLQEASTNATIETLLAASPIFDATFGLRDNPDDPIEETRDLDPGTRVVTPSLLTAIRNDLIPEDLECYTIRILPVDVPGRRELFECNEDAAMADNYFCEHTICIEDNDDPFEVAFVRTMHTVDESAGPVLVCVNLTQPESDILDETVNVFVTDFPASMYIPVNDVPRATPDIPDFFSQYPMAERSDFQQQTPAVNLIDDILISELMRIVCYNQTIYDDLRLEANEYAGLTLGVEDNAQTTVLTLVKEFFDQASILIVDNDRAVVGLEMTFFSVMEDVGYVELCAYVSFPEITCPIEFPFEVGLSTADGTAVETIDYGAINVTLMFDTCETRKCVNVTITEDLVDEPLEFFTYTLTRTLFLDPRIELMPTDGRVEIIDNDVNITVGYNPISYIASESQGSVELTIVIFDPPVGGAPRPFTLVINTQDGTAIAGAPDNDYGAVSGEIVQFDVGDTSQTHTIIINNDMMCENDPNEFFFSNIALDTGVQPIFVIQPQATVTINDEEEPECRPIRVGYEFPVYTTTEGTGVVTLCAVVTNFLGGSPRPFTINATTEDGSAVSGADYVGVVDVPLMFQVGDVRVCHDVVIIDDDDCETPFEDFFSNLEYDSGDMPIIITRDRTRVIINDTDELECEPITVGYDPATYTTTESDGSVTLTVRVFSHPGGAPRPFTLVINTEDGTATVADGDYVPVAGEIIQFNAGDVTQTHIITINDDDECEKDPNENFFSNIALDSGIPDITVTVPQATVTIDDTAEPECAPITVGYDPATYTTTESDGSVTLTVRVFSHPGGAPRPFTLVINTQDGTATVADGDYVPVAGEIIQFNAGDVTQTHTITINDDDECEKDPNENFFSNIALDSGIPEITVTVPQATVTIDDTAEPECAPITVGYDPATYTTTESDGSVTLTVRVFSHPGGAPRPFTLVINTQDGTATVADGDYVPVAGDIIQFNAGDVTQTHTITINDDNECEENPNENFFSNIALNSGIPEITVTVPQATVTIDDSGEVECAPIRVGYEFSVYTTTEGTGVVTLCAVVMNFPGSGSPRPFTINATTEDGSAVSGADYVGVVDVPLMFQMGDVRVCHDVVIIDDDDCETPLIEDFFSNLEYDSGVMPIIITRDRTRVIIDDTAEPECEPITVGYDPATYTTPESDGSVTLTVRVFSHPGGAPRPFTLVVNTEDGTATVADGDYVPVAGFILMFNAGDVTQTHTITINDDDECEDDPNENFFSNIALNSGIPEITVTVPQATVTIDDSGEEECRDIRVGYERTEYTTPEGNTVVELCAIIYEPTMNGPSPRPFTLTYQTSDGSAVAGQDYLASAGQLEFATGDNRVCHEVTILNDDICERPLLEDFFSTLSLVAGKQVIVVDPERARVIIDDSEDCREVFVNDTLTGDPLLTVPIWTDPDVEPGDPIESLCYEVHGDDGSYFNLISDECTSVNAYYQEAVTPSPNIDLNVVTQIGVRARGDNSCWDIQVNLDTCSATVNGGALVGNRFDGITVKPYASSSRVRISVPNCADTMLVMWVFCREGQVEDPVTWEYFDITFIRFVVMRGLNLNEQSHGLIGQFWNVPVTVSSYTGLFGGEDRTDDYIITVDHPQSDPRSFVGLKSDVTWEFEKRVCYYVGNTQAGKLAEVSDPNDSVIEGDYTDYKVDSLFATDFKFSHFDENRC